MRYILAVLLLSFGLSSVPTAYAIESHEGIIQAKNWPSPEHADKIVRLQAVQTIIQHFEEEPEISVTIYYPGGVNGEKWARRMQNWLIALGIPKQYLSLAIGSGGADQLRLQLVDRR